MAETRQAAVPTWLTILLAVALVIALWALVTARGAAGRAEANGEQLARPDLDLVVVPGGPERFPDAFDAAVDDLDEDEAVDPTAHHWITVVLHNDGASDAQGVDVTLDLGDVGTPTYLADLSGFRDLDVGSDGPLVELGIDSIDAGDAAQVFVGIPSDALPEPVTDDWSRAYGDYVGRADVFVGGDDAAIDRWYGGSL